MKKILVILASVAGIFSASSCSSQLEVAPPNKIVDEDIIKIMEGSDESKKQLVLKAIATPFVKYFNMWSSPLPGGVLAPMEYCYQGMWHARSLQGNDMIIGESDASTNDLAGTSYYKGTTSMTNNSVNSNYAHWFGYAYAINQANLLLTYMTEEAAKKGGLAADGRARGLMIRAFSYMCLMEEYCQPYLSGGKEKLGMSLYTVYDPGQAAVARSSAEETWNFIIKDLVEAASYVSTYTTAFSELEDFDAGVANFLLARAYILTGQWNNAIAACDKIINSGKYSFIKNANYGCNPTGAEIPADASEVVFSPVNNAFTALMVNPECILGYIKKSSYNPKDGSNRAGVHNMLNNAFSKEYPGGTQVCIDQRLYDKIAAGDVRKNAWYPKSFKYAYSTNLVPAYASMKDGATHGITDDGISMSSRDLVSDQDYCMFRYSEVVLMKAEAQAQSGQDAAAKTTLNTLLSARSNGALNCDNYPSMSGMSALDMVKLQWRIEMWGENGREYFNNKRWNIDVNRSGSANHWSQYSLKWNEMTLQIPLKELETNPNCVQD